MDNLLQELIALGIVAVALVLYLRSRLRARRRRGACGCSSGEHCGARPAGQDPRRP